MLGESKGRGRILGALALGLALSVSAVSVVQAADDTITVAVNTTTTYQNMDPTGNADAAAPSWLLPVYDTLIRANGDGSYGPELADSWSFADDGTSLTLKLHPGVTFQDGTPFNADAVKQNLDRAKSTKGSASAGKLAAVSSVEVVDDLTVKLDIAAAAAQPLIASLSGIGGMMASPAAFATLADKPVGTGPFKMASIGLTDLTYTRNEDYWGTKPSYTTLKILRQDQTPAKTTYINAMATGSIDVWQVNGGLTEQELALIKSNPNLVVDPSPGGLQQLIYMNRMEAPLDKIEVRQAIGYAIDRDAIAKAANLTPSSESMLPTSRFYNADVAGYYTHDVAKAKELLTKAGYPDGFTTTFYTHLKFQLAAQIIQAELAEVGIKVDLRPLDPPSFIAQCFQQNKCPMLLSGLNAAADPVQVAQDVYMPNSFFNGNHTVPPEISAKVDAVMKIASDEDHLQAGKDLLGQLVTDAPNQVVGFYNAYVIHQKTVEGATDNMSPSGFFDYTALSRTGQ